MTNQEYTDRLREILGKLDTKLKPVRYPNGEKYADEIVIVGIPQAIKAIQQLNNEAIGETEIQVRGITQNKENPMYWTKGTKIDFELRQQLRNILGATMSDLGKLYEALDKTSEYNKLGGRGSGDLADTCYICGISPTNLKALISTAVREARLRGVEEVLLKLKQAPPIDWIDAQSWIDGEYARLQAQLKEGVQE